MTSSVAQQSKNKSIEERINDLNARYHNLSPGKRVVQLFKDFSLEEVILPHRLPPIQPSCYTCFHCIISNKTTLFGYQV